MFGLGCGVGIGAVSTGFHRGLWMFLHRSRQVSASGEEKQKLGDDLECK